MIRFIACLSLACSTLAAFGQAFNPWLDAQEKALSFPSAQRDIIPASYRTLALDLEALLPVLADAPLRNTAAVKTAPSLAIPMPDGGFQDFRIVEAPVLHPDLTAKYPYIRSYAGWSTEDPTAYLRFGVTQKGFHAALFSARHSTVFIDAYARGDAAHYICYFKQDLQPSYDFSCGTADLPVQRSAPAGGVPPKMAGDCQLRSYALALACTGEYAQFHGGTVPLVMAAFAEAMTRVNGIYERETAVTMELVPDNDLLIFLDAATDPYTNNNGSTMLGQNQTTCNNIIGNANYDIGHVFSTGGGGIAFLNAVCNNNNKARGVTGGGSPVGDPFWVDYVAHEMGHQFGGNHTQNNSCNRNNATAMEPGSASTIMGYAGICAPNVQSNSDDYFHAVNLDEIGAHITGNGNACATVIPSGNNAPEVTTAGASYQVPVSTPLVLTAVGSDPDGDALTYCWEQMDNTPAPMPPQPTNTAGPAFRSLNPSESPQRFLPPLPAVVAGTTPTWEVLPAVSRNMFFRCTVRDNHPGAGCTAETDVILQFHDAAGPFLVSEPNTAATVWFTGAFAQVSWDVAQTDLAPVNCSQVEILLSVDGGFSYPYVLAAETANDGEETVSVPLVASDQARVMVRSRNNIFYDISNENFTISEPPSPTFLLSAVPTQFTACPQDTAVFSLDLVALAGFAEPVSCSVTGLPAGTSFTLSPDGPVLPPATVVLTVTDLQGVPPGSYAATITATSPSVTQSADISLVLPEPVTQAPVAAAPSDGTVGAAFGPTPVSWSGLPTTDLYFLEVAASPSFQPTFHTATVSGTSYLVPGTSGETVYYWRVRGINACGAGPASDAAAFQTASISCETFLGAATPVPIPDTEAAVISDFLSVPAGNPVSSVRVAVQIAHSWAGDLIARLIDPQGTVVTLFDRPGVPASTYGCSNDNIVASFYDTAPNTADDFENSCNTNPAVGGDFQPISPLSSFQGAPSGGDWTLEVEDAFPEDGGALEIWSLELCTAQPLPPAILLQNLLLLVQEDQSEIITNGLLQVAGPPDQVVFTLRALPATGTLLLDGTPLQVGDTFTQSQIDNGSLSFQHAGDTIGMDAFRFDVTDSANGWLHNQDFLIQVAGNISAQIAVTQPIDCDGNPTAVIVVTAAGGIPPLLFKLNNSPFQPDNVFTDLGPGLYTATVVDSTGATLVTNTVSISAVLPLSANTVTAHDTLLVVAFGGTAPLSFSLDGQAAQPNPVFPDLPNGSYSVLVTDANGCTTSTTGTISVFPLSATVLTENLPLCHDDSSLSLTVLAAGGNPPYLYSLDGLLFQSSPTFHTLSAGTFSLFVQDEDGTTLALPPFTITGPPALDITALVAGTAILASGSGGTGSLLYNIDNGAFSTVNIFTVNGNGTYLLGVLDENGCTAFTLATVNVPEEAVILTAPPSCAGGGDGTISIDSIVGGIPPFLYSLNGATPQPEGHFDNLPAGNYTVEIIDAEDASLIVPVFLAEPDPLSFIPTINGNSVTVSAAGGTPPYLYSLDAGMTFQTENLFTELANGGYAILVQDENGCTTGDSILINFTFLRPVEEHFSFEVLPNPSDGRFQLVLSARTAEELQLRLFDAAGKLVFENRTWVSRPSSVESLDLQFLPSGTYELQATYGRWSGTRRLLILH